MKDSGKDLPTHSLGLRQTRYLASVSLIAAGIITTPLGITVVHAQEAVAAEDSHDQRQHDIIVTAQRRNERLEDVPMSITALTHETLAAAGVVSMRDLQSITTGYTLAQGGTAPQPAIRGITTIVAGVSFENNVGVYIDGLYQVTPLTLNIDLPDVESVQILKGPQGTLYGRNATGGAILINTIMPKNSWVGKAELTYGRFDDKRASGYIAGPITDGIGVSLAGYTKRSDGWVKLLSRTVPGTRDGGNAIPQAQDAVRVKIAAELTDNLKATLGYNYSYVSSAASAVFANIENTLPYIVNPAAVVVRPVNMGDYAYDIGIEISAKKHEGWLALALDTSIGTFKAVTGYSSTFSSTFLDFDASYVNSGYTIAQARQKTIQQSVDFTIDALENLDLLVGGTYFRDRINTAAPNHSTSFAGIDPAASAAIPKNARGREGDS
jgi:iron complex outermembrane recepter protein